MKTFLGASVGRKFVVALSGLFLVTFLTVHLVVNLTMLLGAEVYNSAAHWMGSNPAVQAIRPLLVAGLLVHIALSAYLAWINFAARPTRYAVVSPAGGSTWQARHMFLLGSLLVLFLALHLSSFAIRMTFGSPDPFLIDGVVMKDAYTLVTERFALWWYVALYVVAMVVLGLHLAHGVQSALHTLGLTNERWQRRWLVVGRVYAIVVAGGFALLPVYFFLQAQMSRS